MFGVYATLFDSMMTHFQRRFERRADQRRAATTAISVFLVINLSTIVSLLRSLRIDVPDLLTNRLGALAVFGILFAANSVFADWRSRSAASPCAEKTAVPKKYAVTYMVATVALFLGSLILLWNAK